MSDLGKNVVENEEDIIAALPAHARVHAVRIADGIVTELHLTNGTILTGAMVVQKGTHS